MDSNVFVFEAAWPRRLRRELRLGRASADRALLQYESFFLSPSAAAGPDPVLAFAAPWAAAVERAAHWVAGWRPTRSSTSSTPIPEEVEVGAEIASVQEGVAEPFPRSDAEMEAKVAALGRVTRRADELRLRTLRELVGILEPVQSVDLLVAAADLEIGMREIGLEHDGE